MTAERRDGAARERLEASRRHFVERFSEVRGSIHTEVRFAPRRRGTILLLVAGAAGFALALALRSRLGHPQDGGE